MFDLRQGCTAPDFTAPIDADLSAAGKQDWQNLSSWWSATDTDRRYCVIAEIRGNFRLKLQDCIARSIPGFVIAPSRDENRLSADEKAAV